ncbi:MAG: hypothetical protein LBC56_08560 [Oscillospiraceae bacterium]|jgi:hypothetical protein|nr:hypothetical protein [Oscillospiraceae bacterium]
MADIRIILKNASKSWDAGTVCRLSYVRRTDTPCDSLDCTVISEETQPEASHICLYLGADCLYEGIVDSQSQLFSPKGSYMQIYSRRKIAALLLDNEARPRDYRSLRFTDLAAAHAFPFGIKGVTAAEDRRAPLFTVAKGMSEWEVIELFAKQIYGLTPYIDEKNRLVLHNRDAMKKHYFSNLDNGANWCGYISLKINRRPSRVISHVYVVNEDGSQLLVENRNAGGTVRRRILSPSTEWALFPRRGAEDIIQTSMERKTIIEIDAPDFLDCSLGDTAIIKEFSSVRECVLDEIELRLDGECKTRLTFRA